MTDRTADQALDPIAAGAEPVVVELPDGVPTTNAGLEAAEAGATTAGATTADETAPDATTDTVAAAPATIPRRRRLRMRLAATLAGMSAIVIKELRGRMRGRRAFVNVTLFLLIVGGFAWMVEVMTERSMGFGFPSAGQGAEIGRAVFAALVLLETILVVILAPAFTSGAISLEREKQTIDMLVVTPISSTAVVLGKLVSALIFVAVLLLASVPFTAIVFVFGGVAPDDVIRAYVVLAVTAVGFCSLGIFFSALIRRTQTATVATYLAVLALTFGALFIWGFWGSVTNGGTGRFGPLVGQPPATLLYPNPAIAQADVLCGTETGFGTWCGIVGTITGQDLFVNDVFVNGGPPIAVPAPGVIGGFVDGRDVIEVQVDEPAQPLGVQVAEPFGPKRDTLWPRMVIAWLVASVALILVSIRLVAPTGGPALRGRIRRPRRRKATG